MSILSFFSAINFVAFLYFGIYILGLEKKSLVNRLFFYLCMCFTIWTFGYTFLYSASDLYDVISWHKVSTVGWCLFAPFFFHFSLAFTGNKLLNKRGNPVLIIYLPGIFFSLSIFLKYGMLMKGFVKKYTGWCKEVSNASPYFWSFASYYSGMLLLGLIVIFLWYKKSHVSRERKQAKVILLSTIPLFIICGTNDIVLPAMNVAVIPELSPIILIFWIFCIWYAIKKYKLLSISSSVAAEDILARIKDMVILIDPKDTVVKVNRALQVLLEYENDKLLQCNISKILGRDTERFLSTLPVLTENPNTEYFDTNYLTASSEEIPVKMTVSSIDDEAGDLIGYVLVAQDVRVMKALEQEMLENKAAKEEILVANEKLKELDKLKTDFLSTVSHELRTPLTSILGFAKVVSKKLTKSIFPLIPQEDEKNQAVLNQVLENVDIIISESKRLTSLINDVLDISKMEAGKIEWKIAECEIEKLLDQAVNSTSSLIDMKGLKLNKHYYNSGITVMCDPDRIIQVVINLISNAVKFTNEGAIDIEARHVNEEVIVSVMDNGIGIAREDHEKVFEKFKQVGDTLTDKPIGTGLGLPICKQIIQSHSGHIWLESELGAGSTFLFSLPFKPGKSADSAVHDMDFIVKDLKRKISHDLSNITGLGRKIMLVDDDPNIRGFLRQEFEAEGYSVIECENGLDAIAKAREAHPDLIIMDIMMPGMDGFDTAAVFKNDPDTLHIPIVILSIIEDKKRGYNLGVDRYYTKPVDAEMLVKDVGEILSGENSKKKVLIVNNGKNGNVVSDVLRKKGFGVIESCKDYEFADKVYALKPDSVILDNTAANMEIIRKIRQESELEGINFILLAGDDDSASDQA